MTPTADTLHHATTGDAAGWLAWLADQAEDSGYLEPLGPRHWAHFADEGSSLLVSFDSLGTLAARPVGELPPAQALARLKGWSHLSLIADGATWFRDRRVWGYVDRLIDEGFFEDFDRVLFYGAGMGAYAACAFSVAAPGSRVLAIKPVATLDPQIAGWDRRDLAARRLDFRSRFGFAPAMIRGQSRVWLLHDPAIAQDAMHVALFADPVVMRLRARHLGADSGKALADMGLLPQVIEAAMEDRLSTTTWAQLWRSRHAQPSWLRRLVAQLEASGHTAREAVVLRRMVHNFPTLTRARQRLDAITQAKS